MRVAKYFIDPWISVAMDLLDWVSKQPRCVYSNKNAKSMVEPQKTCRSHQPSRMGCDCIDCPVTSRRLSRPRFVWFNMSENVRTNRSFRTFWKFCFQFPFMSNFCVKFHRIDNWISKSFHQDSISHFLLGFKFSEVLQSSTNQVQIEDYRSCLFICDSNPKVRPIVLEESNCPIFWKTHNCINLEQTFLSISYDNFIRDRMAIPLVKFVGPSLARSISWKRVFLNF